MPDKDLTPIVLFVYNRPKHTKQTLESLMQNDLASASILFIYADGPKKNATQEQLKNIKETRKIITQKKWCGTVKIIENIENKGLSQSIITGVTEVVKEYGKVIVLEDDIVTSQGFLKFMNTSLEKYKNEEKVFQISGFNFPLKEIKVPTECFFVPLISSWGWATWDRAWQKFDPLANGYEKLKTSSLLRHQFDLNSSYPYSDMLIAQMEKKNIDSWAIRWLWTLFKNNKLSLFPVRSFVTNIGYGDDATHTKLKMKFITEQTLHSDHFILNYPEKVECDKKKWKLVKQFISVNYTSKKQLYLKQKFTSLYYDLLLNINSKSA